MKQLTLADFNEPPETITDGQASYIRRLCQMADLTVDDAIWDCPDIATERRGEGILDLTKEEAAMLINWLKEELGA